MVSTALSGSKISLNSIPENAILRIIFAIIQEKEWHEYNFNFSFKAKKTEFGNGFELSDFKVQPNQVERVNFLSARERKERRIETYKKIENKSAAVGASRGGRVLKERRLAQKVLEKIMRRDDED